MKTTEVLIVGGGPAGSSCAKRLREHGVDCLLLDRQDFPRTKLCAGWITPEVISDLKLEVSEYPHRFLTFETIIVHFFGLSFRLRATQHSIRRFEFDHWLLQRSGVKVIRHQVKKIERVYGDYVIDGEFSSKYLVGAGGTHCPVFRSLFSETHPRGMELQALALECEFPFEWKDGDCHLWFFLKGLPGYSWYVPKAESYLNVGLGAIGQKLKKKGDSIKNHWHLFLKHLERVFPVSETQIRQAGHSYFLRGSKDVEQKDNAFVIGDAAGLATRDLCEGIGPAIRSGIRAADSIALGNPYRLSSINRLSLPGLLGRFLEWRFTS